MSEISDFQKLGALNSQLKSESIPYQNKVLLIYQQILEEITEGCNQHHEISDLEEELDASSSKNERIQQNLLN